MNGGAPIRVVPFQLVPSYATFELDLGLVLATNDEPLGSDVAIGFGWEGVGTAPAQGLAIDKLELLPAAAPTIEPEPHVALAGAPDCWDAGFDGSGVLVLEIDLGVANDHPALDHAIWSNPGELANGLDDDGNGYADDLWGWDFADGDAHPYDPGHGTNVAGILVGDGTGNGGRRTGLAPGAELAVARVGSLGDALAAYQYAIAIGADVVSSSFSFKFAGDPDYHLLRAAVEAELAAGIAHANSAGNEALQLGTHPVPYNVAAPANVPGVVGVGAVELDDAPYAPSSLGPAAWEDVTLTNPAYPHAQDPKYWDHPWAAGASPGLAKPDLVAFTHVRTTDGSAGYVASFPGTSAAAPQVGGALALMRDANPAVPPRQLAEALRASALDVGPAGPDTRHGAGRLRAYEALRRVIASVVATPLDPKPGDDVALSLTGPAGSPYWLLASAKLGTTPTSLGFDLELVQPVVIASGALTEAPIVLVHSLFDSPALSGLVFHLQLVTDDTTGATGAWQRSLVETVVIQ